MVRTFSKMIPLGSLMPNFSLLNVSDNTLYNSQDHLNFDAYLVMFICNHCPYVKHIANGMALLSSDYKNKNISIVAINSNDVQNYPDDSPLKMREEIEKRKYFFPYLYDELQDVAKKFSALCTPDFFLYDKKMQLVYRGQFDSSRPSNDIEVNAEDLRDAIDSTLNNQKPSIEQKPSLGCNIKWKI